MSKVIKQMQMDVLKKDFHNVRDMVLLNVVGLDAVTDNQIRLGLRKKGIRMQVVKNSLARRVFSDNGITLSKGWEGPTTVVWGANSIAELSKELEGIVKKNDKKMKVKLAVSDGLEVTFAQALKMPTREQAIGTVVSLLMGPGSRLISALLGPGSTLASQIKTLEEKKEGEAEVTEGEAAPAPAPA